MGELDTTVILFKINKKSSRGYYFKEPAVDEFLASPTCKARTKNRTALGIITHKDRKLEKCFDGQIPTEDQLLLLRLPTHTITRYFKEDGYLKADIRIFDPELFSGETKERIMFIQGLIRSGVKLTTSAGIEAYYNAVTKEGEKIYDIVGVDFTLSPDFKDSHIE